MAREESVWLGYINIGVGGGFGRNEGRNGSQRRQGGTSGDSIFTMSIAGRFHTGSLADESLSFDEVAAEKVPLDRLLPAGFPGMPVFPRDLYS